MESESTGLSDSEATAAPTEAKRRELKEPERGIALCLSGGGYRAMLFHAGALWRLNEAGFLPRIDRVSSVSGGAITAGVLALRWDSLDFDTGDVAENFVDEVVGPLRGLADRTIDWKAVLRGVVMRGSAGNRVAASYEKHLFGDMTLQDLPDEPRFVFNATSLQSGVLWRFSKPYMADYRVGMINRPRVPLATAVAASSAFPPFLSPLRLKLSELEFEPNSGKDMQYPPYTKTAVLTDGGVYDNLGIETAFKRYATVLISDGGGEISPKKRPWTNWPVQLLRVTGVIDNQVRSLRKSRAIDDFNGPTWSGTYWGIRTDIGKYGLSDALPCDHVRTLDLAKEKTRLAKLNGELQNRLINWGYAVCDAAMRAYVDRDIDRPVDFPYPDSGV